MQRMRSVFESVPIQATAGKYTVAFQLYIYYDGVKYPPVGGDGDWQVLGTVEK